MTAGLTIVVGEDSWDAYGNPFSPHDKMLMSVLRKAGGISDTVDPGTYNFNIEYVDHVPYSILEKVE